MGNCQSSVIIRNGFSEADASDIMALYYSDWPISGLPRLVLNILVERWSRRGDVFYITARLDGIFAGFLFAQTIGTHPWRTLLSRPPILLPFTALMWVRNRLQRVARAGGKPKDVSLNFCHAPFRPIQFAPDVCREEQIGQRAARVEFIYVHPSFRGKNIAAALLQGLSSGLRTRGVEWLMAHVASPNEPSVRAFRNAGWTLFSVDPVSLLACTPTAAESEFVPYAKGAGNNQA